MTHTNKSFWLWLCWKMLKTKTSGMYRKVERMVKISWKLYYQEFTYLIERIPGKVCGYWAKSVDSIVSSYRLKVPLKFWPSKYAQGFVSRSFCKCVPPIRVFQHTAPSFYELLGIWKVLPPLAWHFFWEILVSGERFFKTQVNDKCTSRKEALHVTVK